MYGSGLEKLQYRCVPEINQMVNRIASFDGQAFDPWNIFYDSACNVMLDLVSYFKAFENIRIYHECEGKIEKSVLRIAVWHHEACRVMANDDPEGQIFLSYPHTNNRFFFLLTTVFIY